QPDWVSVMERLRRKIELYRQHQINCESRYEKASVERLELERQQTVALHQRCLQTKAKRASKHRQPPPSGDQAGQRAAAAGAEHGENGGTAPEQSRNSTLIALQETVKRKLESAGSPLSREPANGYGEGFPPNKKPSLDNGAPNGALLDSKRGISNLLSFNGTNGGAAGSADGVQEGDLNFQRKEMKQEPEDILPIMPPSVGGNNSLIPDLNLNEQEWKELMEELNFTVPIEDIQDILNNGFEDRKDPLELGGPSARGGPSSKGLIPPDLVSVKAEFPSASAAFEQDPHMGSPHVRSTPSGPPHPTSSPVASSASSPALDQNNYPAPPHGATNAMTSVSGNNPCAAQPAVNSAGGNHGNAPYLNNQAAVAAALKQQILEQQKKQQILQRQQLMAEQEKRQQDQQLQRHLTRPPPQYQDQSGPPTNQNPFPQQQVGQFPASSQPMGNGSMGVSSSSSRVFSQNQSMMGMTMGQGGGPGTTVAPPTAASQADISLASCGGGGSGAGVDPLYNNLNLQHGLQRQQMGAMSAPYRQSVLGQQHLKPQPNVAMLKQQQLAAARMPGAMQSTMGGGLQAQMQGGQGATWQQQQLATQPASGNASLPPNVFNNPPNAFHMQRVPKMAPAPVPFASSLGGLPMTGMNPGQQMIQTNMAAQQRAPPPAPNMGQPLANQQQAQQQPANQNLSDMVAFGQQVSGRPALQCNQGYQMSRTANQQQQQVSFGYNAAAGSFAAESELVDSLLKGQEWMAELDALLANHQ
uniref:Mastermind-like transcriptional coactivator 1 n=1 Tax=Oryzias melastigma TaxID=30732 RepID=A0A3B3CRC6_ORYME